MTRQSLIDVKLIGKIQRIGIDLRLRVEPISVTSKDYITPRRYIANINFL